MSAEHDRKLQNLFSVILGGLVGITIVIVFLVNSLASRAQSDRLQSNSAYRRITAQRIAPEVRIAIAGQDNSALNVQATTPVAAAPPVAAAVLPGDEVYRTACAVCHATGLAGAPKFADRAVWAPRIAQGATVLRKHALEGFQGKAGVMPMKGGQIAMADQSILNAVDYMVTAAR